MLPHYRTAASGRSVRDRLLRFCRYVLGVLRVRRRRGRAGLEDQSAPLGFVDLLLRLGRVRRRLGRNFLEGRAMLVHLRNRYPPSLLRKGASSDVSLKSLE